MQVIHEYSKIFSNKATVYVNDDKYTVTLLYVLLECLWSTLQPEDLLVNLIDAIISN